MDRSETARLLRIIAQKHKPVETLEQRQRREALGVGDVVGRLTGAPTEICEPPVDPQEAILVCMPIAEDGKLILPDNDTGPCAWGCGKTVQWRPNETSRMTKVCIQCVAERGETQ